MIPWSDAAIYLFIGWYLVGVVTFIINIIRDGFLTIENMVEVIFLSIFGPIVTIGWIVNWYEHSDFKYTVIWKRKDKVK